MFKVTISFQGICQAFHSELVVINDAEENSLLKEIITNIKGSAILFFTIVIADKHVYIQIRTCQSKNNALFKKIFFQKKKVFKRQFFFLFLFAVYTEIHFFFLCTGAFSTNFWMDGSDQITEGLWVWASTMETIRYTNWEQGEPNNYIGIDEDCLELYLSNFKWNDIRCTHANHFICEKEYVKLF